MKLVILAGLLFISISTNATPKTNNANIQNIYHSEITLAKEAAPKHITEQASFMIWQTEQFVTIKQGSNGFTCLVLRDPQGRYEPSCLNTPAMKAVLPVYEYQTRKLYQGIPIKHINTAITQKAKTGEFPIPETGALVYMMSPNNKFYDYRSQKLLDIAPHIMHYLPKIDEGTLGFNGKHGLPAFYNEYPHLSVIHIHTDKM